MAKKEAQARIRINRLLEQAGWRFFPDKNGSDNIICESRIAKKIYAPSTDFGDDFEKTAHGFIDYLLLNSDRRPVALVEAKRESIHPLEAKPCAFNQDVKAIRPNKTVNSSYLRYILKNQEFEFRRILETAAHGTLKIKTEHLLEIQIPIPPLAEQEKLVAELEAERKLVEANRELAARFSQKLQTKLAEIWGE